MKILVTGANGYLGRGIVKQLLDDGCEVIATDLSTSLCDSRAKCVPVDLFSVKNPYEFFSKPDVLLHLAWQDGFVHNSQKHIDNLPMHVQFLETMFKSEIKCISVMGSMHEIGFYEGSIDEDTPCKPLNLYGIAKNSLRHIVEVFAKQYKKTYQWLRGYYIVENTSYGSSIFSKITKAAEEGNTEFPFTTGQNQYDFLDYKDFCHYVSATVEQKEINGIINICSGYPEKLGDRVEKFIEENSFNIRLQYGVFPERAYDSKAVWGNSIKIDSIMNMYHRNNIRVFVTGVGGQLGYDVMNNLCSRGYEVIGSDIAHEYSGGQDGSAVAKAKYVAMDITDADTVDKVITEINPDAVIHCAAWTAVDAAEDVENIEKVRAINVGGTENIAKVCKKLNCKMVYISTDYVFNGQGETPWEADCKDYAPLSVYGQAKLEGELAVHKILDKYFIVRVAWVFGKNGKNFIKTMLNVGKKFDTLKVVNDQIGTPTYTYDLARLLVDMVETEKYGYYHATNEGGFISWYDFAVEIFKQAGYTTTVLPVTTAEYGISKAARPFNSRLDKSKLVENGFEPLPTWQDALSRYLKEIGE